ncbi:MAG: DUF1697 domain-containing protein, partial [Polyangiaceae bacterium]|nr:DUF1697 domain-containing protein [Polyangiaceae bacterium]
EHVALLRGINVGGKNKLPMKELVPLFEQAGCRAVRTYIQSGNVVFRAARARAASVPEIVAEAIRARLGFRAPVVLRTADELGELARGNPFVRSGADVGALHVVFLAERPTASRVAALDPGRSPPDELVVRGREIYLLLPNGVARTKLTNAYFDATLATTSTVRNWRTVLALLEMTDRPSGR